MKKNKKKQDKYLFVQKELIIITYYYNSQSDNHVFHEPDVRMIFHICYVEFKVYVTEEQTFHRVQLSHRYPADGCEIRVVVEGVITEFLCFNDADQHQLVNVLLRDDDIRVVHHPTQVDE